MKKLHIIKTLLVSKNFIKVHIFNFFFFRKFSQLVDNKISFKIDLRINNLLVPSKRLKKGTLDSWGLT